MTDYLEGTDRFCVMPELLGLDYRLSDRAFRLWFRIDRFAGAKRSAFPSRAALADELECSVASLDRAIVELVETGWLTKKRAVAGGGNVYRLTREATKAHAKIITAAVKAKAKARKEGRSTTNDVIESDHTVTVTVNRSSEDASSQVSGGGVLTSEDRGGVLTSEDRVSSPMRTGVLTSEDYKEEATKEASTKEPPYPPRGDAAGAAVEGVLALDDWATDKGIVGDFAAEQWTEPPAQEPTTLTLISSPALEVDVKSDVDRFEEFWSIYPKPKKARAAAERAWAKAVKAVGAQAIIDGAQRLADDPNRPGGPTDHRGKAGLNYLKDASTWLNQGCWDDDPYPPRAGDGQGAVIDITWDRGSSTAPPWQDEDQQPARRRPANNWMTGQ